MDEMKHPKRYKAYREGIEVGRAEGIAEQIVTNEMRNAEIEYINQGIIQELKEQLESAKSSIIRIVFEDDKAINELREMKEAYRFKHNKGSKFYHGLFLGIISTVGVSFIIGLIWIAINNTLV